MRRKTIPEVDPDVVGDPLCLDDLEVLECGLTLTLPPALSPYSLVELTDLVVSAGRYGTGTVLIPPDREYLEHESEYQEEGGKTDLRSALVEAGWRLAEDRVRLGDMGRGLTEGGAGATLYLDWSIHFQKHFKSLKSLT